MEFVYSFTYNFVYILSKVILKPLKNIELNKNILRKNIENIYRIYHELIKKIILKLNQEFKAIFIIKASSLFFCIL